MLIYHSLGSSTEAAGMGALGSIILAIAYKKFSLGILHETLLKTLKITHDFTVLLGGMMFSGVFIGSGGVAVTPN